MSGQRLLIGVACGVLLSFSAFGRSADLALPRGAGTGGGDVVEAEPNDSRATATRATDLPFQMTGALAQPGDVDVACVDVTAGQRVEVDVFAEFGALASPLDPRVTVTGADGEVLAFNDDRTPGTRDACAIFEAPSSGTVYIEVRAPGDQWGEAYRYVAAAWPVTTDVFAAENAEAEPNDTAAEAPVVAMPAILRGTVSAPGDADWLRLDASGGFSTLVVDVHSASYGLPLRAVVELYDADGVRIWRATKGDGDDPRFNVVLPTIGVYALRVTSRDGGDPSCAYVLSASLQDASTAPFLSALRFSVLDDVKYLERVSGVRFDPDRAKVEVRGRLVDSHAVARSPSTRIRVSPPAELRPGAWVSVVNPDGRRSNSFVPFPKP